MPHRWKTWPTWAFLSLAANGLLTLLLVWLLRDYWLSIDSQLNASTTRESLMREIPASASPLGPRHQLSYQKWVAILEQEAKVVAENPPQHLNVLAGDSLSLWFPPDLLPSDTSWLNQGISGEVTAGLLRRLDLFDRSQPETIFVMIGINDLIRQVTDEDLLWNYRLIVRRLRRVHPQSQIVLQSILPHGGEQSTWEGRSRLLDIPNDRIRSLNLQLETIAQEERVKYFNLYPLFTDDRGNLRPELTTDGLHLNRQGYLVWRSALLMYRQMELNPVALEQRGRGAEEQRSRGAEEQTGRRAEGQNLPSSLAPSP